MFSRVRFHIGLLGEEYLHPLSWVNLSADNSGMNGQVSVECRNLNFYVRTTRFQFIFIFIGNQTIQTIQIYVYTRYTRTLVYIDNNLCEIVLFGVLLLFAKISVEIV